MRIRGEAFEAGEVGVHDLLVAVETEDQGDVDVAPLGDHLLDCGKGFNGSRDLDHQVRPIDPLMKGPRRCFGSGSIVGEAGVHLDADIAVEAPAVVEQWGEHVEGTVDVGEYQCPVVIGDRTTVAHQLAELIVVVGGALDRLLEDGGIAGETTDPVADLLLELTAGEIAALQVVEPRALPELVVEEAETIHGVNPCSRVPWRGPRRWGR